jgi:gluconolactonase
VRSIIDETAEIKTIARGFTWSEGTLWLKDQQMLLFSDVPENKIYSWSENKGLSIWLEPSGYTGPAEIKREGSNGLILNKNGQLVICQHGDRRIALMNAQIASPTANFTTLADHWKGKKFNSPNDAAYDSKGVLYFTDPPYGLPGQEKDPEKEIEFSGVYKIGSSGETTLLIDSLKDPNGIAFSPNNKFMYVSNSDPEHAVWVKYTKNDSGIFDGKILHDATDLTDKVNGLPDGLKVHPSGYLFATGPGGIWIFSPEDEISARIYIPQATANCAFDDNFSHLYIAADSIVIRVSLKTQL